jgi:uncharacterized RDD family membrane protein YckC
MNEFILDTEEVKNTQTENLIEYATKSQRFLAALIDGLLIIGISYLFQFLHILNHQVFAIKVSIWLVLIAMAYKPLMEMVWGQTVGKFITGIKVLNNELDRANLYNIIGRHSITIVSNLSTIFLTSSNAQLISAIQNMDFAGLSMNFILVYSVRLIISLAVIIDAISIWFNEDKIMIHDKIGRTRVVSLRVEHRF